MGTRKQVWLASATRVIRIARDGGSGRLKCKRRFAGDSTAHMLANVSYASANPTTAFRSIGDSREKLTWRHANISIR